MTNPIDYLNNTVWCKIAPSGNGVGLFAIRDIPKGLLLTSYSIHEGTQISLGRMAIPINNFHMIHPAIRSLILDRNLFREEQEIFYFYSPNFEQNLRTFINHSDTPNSHRGIYSLRDISEGEEITQNYKDMFEEKDPHPLIKEHMTFLWQ